MTTKDTKDLDVPRMLYHAPETPRPEAPAEWQQLRVDTHEELDAKLAEGWRLEPELTPADLPAPSGGRSRGEGRAEAPDRTGPDPKPAPKR